MLRTALVTLVVVATAEAQSALPAVFVANNGNARGSVSSLTINADGTLAFVQDLVTGTSGAGTNAYAISLSPDGRYLAVSHTTAATVLEQISLIRVNADATLTFAAAATTPNSPLDLTWIDNAYLAVTRTNSGGINEVILYRFDEGPPRLTELDRADVGSFVSRLALTPDRSTLIANDSPLGGGGMLWAIRVDVSAGDLTRTDFEPAGIGYCLGMGVSPDGLFVYAASGASSSQGRIAAFNIEPDATFNAVPGSPFDDAGSSPKQCVASPDGLRLFVAHGTDSTIRRHDIAPDGSLTDVALVYDVGIQGSCGELATLRVPRAGGSQDLLLFTDKETYDGTPRGVFSAEIATDGTVTLLTTRLDTGGVGTNDIAAWAGAAGPGCDPDVNADGNVDQDDVICMIDEVAGNTGCSAQDPDFNRDGNVDQDDVIAVITAVAGGGCP